MYKIYHYFCTHTLSYVMADCTHFGGYSLIGSYLDGNKLDSFGCC